MYNTLQCNYQYVSNKNVFVMAAGNFIEDRSISIIMDSAFIKEDSIYCLDYYWANNNSARYGAGSSTYYTKRPMYAGEISVQHFDAQKQIISGTFWFDAVDTSTGNIVQVREGRFDVHYTQ